MMRDNTHQPIDDIEFRGIEAERAVHHEIEGRTRVARLQEPVDRGILRAADSLIELAGVPLQICFVKQIITTER